MDESWVSVAQYSEPSSAQVASARLTSENIPNAVSRPAFSAGLYYLRVPPESSDAAKQVLEANADLDDRDLTEAALRDPPPDDYVPSSGDSQARLAAVMMPLAAGLLFLVSAGIFVVSLAIVITKGVPMPKYCGPGGCRSIIAAIILSGLMTPLTFGLLLASFRGREDDK